MFIELCLQGEDAKGKKRLKFTVHDNSESSESGSIAVLDDDETEDEDVPIAALTRRKKKAAEKGISVTKTGPFDAPSNGEASGSSESKDRMLSKTRKSIKKD